MFCITASASSSRLLRLLQTAVTDLEALKGQDVQFRIIEVNRQRRRAVGSIRSVLREQRKAAQAKFWESVEEGQEFTGTVKSLTNFGAFVDLGGVDGMIHISELSWNRIKHPKRSCLRRRHRSGLCQEP